jgi:hypothetical protein
MSQERQALRFALGQFGIYSRELVHSGGDLLSIDRCGASGWPERTEAQDEIRAKQDRGGDPAGTAPGDSPATQSVVRQFPANSFQNAEAQLGRSDLMRALGQLTL